MDLNPNSILREKIKRNMEKQGPNPFFPTSKWQMVLEEKDIKATLDGVRPKLPAKEQIVSELTEFVTKKAYPIFAGLVMMRKPWLITTFYMNDFDQDNLPIQYTFDQNNDVDFEVDGGDGRKDIGTMFRGEDPAWEEEDIEQFCVHKQWEFTAPVFEKGKFRYGFAAMTALPFTTKPKALVSGGFGRVEKVTVHRDHIDHTTLPLYQRSRLDKTAHPVIAVKTLHSGAFEDREKDAEKEARSLEAVRKLNSDNLIKAIAYYRIDSKHCFLFPMAEHGNLWDFWAARRKKKEQGESHRGDNMFLVWVFTQLVGIADALVELHGDVPNIRHGDLKPENILCFQDGSYPENADDLGEPRIRLVITDVGISKGHKGPTQKRAVTSTLISTTRYEPPEMDRTREDGTELSRRYDVWSLGCIVLEFLIWLLYDFDELDNFTAALKDRFYVSDKKGIRIHPTVSEWIKRIKDDEKNCQEETPWRKLVSLIEEKLLVVKVETLPGTLREVVPVESPRNQILRKLRDKLRKSQQATEKIAEMMGRRRASAKDTRDELGKILEDIKQHNYKIKREG